MKNMKNSIDVDQLFSHNRRSATLKIIVFIGNSIDSLNTE